MDDTLFQTASLPVHEQIRLPDEQFFIPDTYQNTTDVQSIKQQVAGADSVIIADADLDGLGAAAAHFAVFEDSVYVSGGPHESKVSTDEALQIVADYASNDVTVTIADIGLDSVEEAASLQDLYNSADTIYWCDHHPWQSEEALDFVEAHTTRFEHDTTDDTTDSNGVIEECNARCGAQITADVLAEECSHTYSETFRDGLSAIAAHDLWRKDEDGAFIHNKTEELTAFATTITTEAHSPYNDTKVTDFINPFLNHGTEICSLPTTQQKIETQLTQKSQKLQQFQDEFESLATTGTITLNHTQVKLAVLYGNLPTNEVSDELQRNHGFDLIVTLTPTGGMSLRSSNSFPHCNTIAYQFDGGGHPQASGASITSEFDTITDYIAYWDANGQQQRQTVFNTIKQMPSEHFD